MNNGTIRHIALFTLKYSAGAPEIQDFLKDGADILSVIPVVQNFEVLRQVSAKCEYDFGFSMEFENQGAYETYNNHPSHQAFVKGRWDTEVVKFQEIDLTK
ncbi:Dabb family protein [Paenibacillus monticola]|uniref:Dabb family protein n=1 Tax=Paenibacillus monticola TaxID=2666075 RepID=A0A7X2H6W3_9BACL|nr:Dabb family protein [Paenibacillus monticola]MRN54553.1 Dabb family protein [Paenibacillus monticola]